MLGGCRETFSNDERRLGVRFPLQSLAVTFARSDESSRLVARCDPTACTFPPCRAVPAPPLGAASAKPPKRTTVSPPASAPGGDGLDQGPDSNTARDLKRPLAFACEGFRSSNWRPAAPLGLLFAGALGRPPRRRSALRPTRRQQQERLRPSACRTCNAAVASSPPDARDAVAFRESHRLVS